MFSLLVFFLTCSFSFSQNIDVDNLSLEDLMNIKATVASKTEKSIRQSPGIVTVITKEEIKKLGARDLMDVLLIIPGFNFAYDVEGVVGLSVRGNWAHEGKFSLLIDGQEMNELMYSSTQFGNHYPVDHIKQIEVIRGPGSAIYGGFSELAVIQVTTEKGADIAGARATVTYGQMREGLGRRNLSLQVGQKWKKWDISIAGLIGQGRRSDGSFTGYDIGTPNQYETYKFSSGNANNLNPNWLNIGATNGKLDFRFIYDNYKITAREIYGYTGLSRGLPVDFTSMYTSLKYDWKLNSKVTISPYINYKNQTPWKVTDPQIITFAQSQTFDASIQRTRLGMSSLLKWSKKGDLLVGGEIYKDNAHARTWSGLAGPVNFSMTGTNNIGFDGKAAYAQISHNFNVFEVTAGARYEQLNAPKGRSISKTVPRIAFVKMFEKWHLKGLASQAYRVPSLFNFDADYEANHISTIKPETTTTYEAEAGFNLNKNSYLTFNLFSTHISDPIVYGSNGTQDVYHNYPQVETQGVEVDYRLKGNWGFANMTYSYYQRGTNQVPSYDIPNSKELLGVPQHKYTLLSSWKTGWNQLTVNPSLVFMSSKHSYAFSIANDAEYLKKLSAVTLLNIYISHPDVLIQGLELGLGVFNLLDQENRYAQAYNSQVGSIPGPSREIVLKATYSKNF